MENLIKQYSKLLDSSLNHLSYETVSAYINSHNALSGKEKLFIGNHLKECGECGKKFIDVFDEDFEFDEKTIRIKLHQIIIERDKKFYQSEDGSVELMFGIENLKVYLKFTRLSDEIKNQNFRISNGREVLRILSAEENKPYNFDKTVLTDNIFDIYLEVLKIYDHGKTGKVIKLNKNFVYAAAAAIIAMFFIGYFYFSTVEKKSAVYNEETKIENDSLSKSKGKGTGKELLTENITNEEDFKTNPVLDNFVNRNIRSEEKRIKIISPPVNDTLKTPFYFYWSSERQPSVYKVDIVNNKNKSVWSKSAKENRLSFDGKLNNGLYYWKIFFDNQLMSVSKFYIIN